MDFDTGEADPLTLKAHPQRAFAAQDRGLSVFRRRAAVKLVIADIGIPETCPRSPGDRSSRRRCAPGCRQRENWPRALIVAGSVNYTGAAALAALAAVRSGAGLVTLGIGPCMTPSCSARSTYVLLPSALGAVTTDAIQCAGGSPASFPAPC